MKKQITAFLAIIVLCLSVCGCGIVESQAGEDTSVPTPLYGTYYLGGVVNDDAYVELTEETIVLKGDKVEEYFINDIKDFLDTDSEEIISKNLNNFMEQYAEPSDYAVSYIGLEGAPYAILNSWDRDEVRADNRYSGSGYWYDGVDTLSLSAFGDFVYIDE